MLLSKDIEYFSNHICKWYLMHKRELPWRETSDPYKIWISEIILQQTRVIQGINYYHSFIDRFPTIEMLAKAHEEDVLKLWQGLGYYSRARNIHAAAKMIMEHYGGKFPTEHTEVLKLKGIGEYTAAAICSFAYNQAYAVVDGNVYRVLARAFGISTAIDSSKGKKEFATLAQDLISKQDPATHNQAIMEFGAMQCTPANPDCDNCILKVDCVAYKMNNISALPIKKKKTKQRNRYFNYLYINYSDSTYIQKRTSKDIWQNLYEFPLIETNDAIEIDTLLKLDEFKAIINTNTDFEISSTVFKTKHVLSHQNIYASFYTINAENKKIISSNLTEVKLSEIDKYPISRLIEIFIEQG